MPNHPGARNRPSWAGRRHQRVGGSRGRRKPRRRARRPPSQRKKKTAARVECVGGEYFDGVHCEHAAVLGGSGGPWGELPLCAGHTIRFWRAMGGKALGEVSGSGWSEYCVRNPARCEFLIAIWITYIIGKAVSEREMSLDEFCTAYPNECYG